MAKQSRRRVTKPKTRRSVTRSLSSPSLLNSGSRGAWGKDQPMVLALSAGIVILIVLSLFLSGWL